MTPCQKGCVRDATRFTNGTMWFQTPNRSGARDQKAAYQVAVPSELQQDYRKMVGMTRLHSAPTLEFYNDLHGVGGLFLPAAWAILVGVRDMEDIATRMLQQFGDKVLRVYLSNPGASYPSYDMLFAYVRDAASRRCMAHELGHAIISKGAPNPYAPDGEAGADYYAGRLEAAAGNRSRELGEIFFWSIGCTGPSCTHPAPPVRAQAYGGGFHSQSIGV